MEGLTGQENTKETKRKLLHVQNAKLQEHQQKTKGNRVNKKIEGVKVGATLSSQTPREIRLSAYKVTYFDIKSAFQGPVNVVINSKALPKGHIGIL